MVDLPLRLLLEGDVAVLLDAELVTRVERVAVAQPLLLQGHVLLQRLVAQDLDLVHQDLGLLLHLSERLRRRLDLVDVLVAVGLDDVVQLRELAELRARLGVALREVHDDELLDLELLVHRLRAVHRLRRLPRLDLALLVELCDDLALVALLLRHLDHLLLQTLHLVDDGAHPLGLLGLEPLLLQEVVDEDVDLAAHLLRRRHLPLPLLLQHDHLPARVLDLALHERHEGLRVHQLLLGALQILERDRVVLLPPVERVLLALRVRLHPLHLELDLHALRQGVRLCGGEGTASEKCAKNCQELRRIAPTVSSFANSMFFRISSATRSFCSIDERWRSTCGAARARGRGRKGRRGRRRAGGRGRAGAHRHREAHPLLLDLLALLRLRGELGVEEAELIDEFRRLRLETLRRHHHDVRRLLVLLGLRLHLHHLRVELHLLRLDVALLLPQQLRPLGALVALLRQLREVRLVLAELGARLVDRRLERVDLRLQLGRLPPLRRLHVGGELGLRRRQLVHLLLQQQLALLAHRQLALALGHLGAQRRDRLVVLLRARRRLLELRALGAEVGVQLLRLLEQVLLVLVRLEHHLVQLRVLALVQLRLRHRELPRRRELVERRERRRVRDVGDVRREAVVGGAGGRHGRGAERSRSSSSRSWQRQPRVGGRRSHFLQLSSIGVLRSRQSHALFALLRLRAARRRAADVRQPPDDAQPQRRRAGHHVPPALGQRRGGAVVRVHVRVRHGGVRGAGAGVHHAVRRRPPATARNFAQRRAPPPPLRRRCRHSAAALQFPIQPTAPHSSLLTARVRRSARAASTSRRR